MQATHFNHESNNNITWIDGGEPAQLAPNYSEVMAKHNRLQSDARHDLPEEHPQKEALYAEQSANYDEIVRAYLYTHVSPGQLPAWIEDLLLGCDFNATEWAVMLEEVRKLAEGSR
ncbi:hypothetical protein [Virgibacillus salexigens]|uniref:Uncharacterized protein n=1 Tax=Virgibacillus massiliensis TaxID=1462526 RepID=A0A024Q9X3_9BACI|nr:hypothetical protein [Virgibacillus massiliensis]CDQ39062.1 hypothetical protein BN990_01344 [Virgibacillus massiliensis]